SNQFNYNSGYRDASGKMYFGSAKGMISFNPQRVLPEAYRPPLFITGFYINEQELKPLQAAKEMVQVYSDWNEFFTERTQQRLELSAVMGLFGELFALHQKLEESDATLVNDQLRSWTGPYGRGHDFVYETVDIEIKTIECTKTDVLISSEHQLEPESGKELLLKVFKAEINGENGLCLSELITNVRNIITAKLGDLPLFLRSLQKAGVPVHEAKEYDQYTFCIKQELCFDCNLEGFPRLTKSNIPTAVNTLRYKLKTGLLTDYLIEQKQY
ncbi:MAG: PD-(D/E)XK motif protein, partial [Sphingobacteriales bacterium]